MINKLEDFAGSPLPFESITHAFLRSSEGHLIEKLGNKLSTVQSNLGIIRARFRREIRDEIILRGRDPYFDRSNGDLNQDMGATSPAACLIYSAGSRVWTVVI